MILHVSWSRKCYANVARATDSKWEKDACCAENASKYLCVCVSKMCANYKCWRRKMWKPENILYTYFARPCMMLHVVAWVYQHINRWAPKKACQLPLHIFLDMILFGPVAAAHQGSQPATSLRVTFVRSTKSHRPVKARLPSPSQEPWKTSMPIREDNKRSTKMHRSSRVGSSHFRSSKPSFIATKAGTGISRARGSLFSHSCHMAEEPKAAPRMKVVSRKKVWVSTMQVSGVMRPDFKTEAK